MLLYNKVLSRKCIRFNSELNKKNKMRDHEGNPSRFIYIYIKHANNQRMLFSAVECELTEECYIEHNLITTLLSREICLHSETFSYSEKLSTCKPLKIINLVSAHHFIGTGIYWAGDLASVPKSPLSDLGKTLQLSKLLFLLRLTILHLFSLQRKNCF